MTLDCAARAMRHCVVVGGHMAEDRVGTGARATAEAELPPPSKPRADSQPESRTIGRYLVLRRIGDGGMGTVFSAYDEQLDRRIAIKILHQAATAQGRQRLVREAQALARLGHPNVVYVYEVGEVDERLFLAMEFVEGCTLADWQSVGKRAWPEIVRMYIEAGRGLLAAHEAGLVHRDFKPENVLVGKDGRPRVVDFGLARAPQEAELPMTAPAPPRPLDKALTVEGTILGTPQYMSPEPDPTEAERIPSVPIRCN